jgi:hypothetical protein
LRRMQQRARAYQLIGNKLYKTSITGPLFYCLRKAEGKELLAEIHSGMCGWHIGSRALTTKVFRQAFYWPSIINDASKIISTCEACQKFSPNSRASFQPSQLITPLWPLQRWGIDIVGLLTGAQGNYIYTVIAVEYFTKWIEAKHLVNIAATGLKRFFCQNIICRFGVLRQITVDKAKQFDCDVFKDFCHQMGVEAAFALVYHPKSNGAVEQTNTLTFAAIKKFSKTGKKEMNRGIAESYIESQHNCFQSNEFHAGQVALWRGANNTQRNKI